MRSAERCDASTGGGVFDDASAIRFVAWTGLSDDYRGAVEVIRRGAATQSIRNPFASLISDSNLPDALKATVKAEASLPSLSSRWSWRGNLSASSWPITKPLTP